MAAKGPTEIVNWAFRKCGGGSKAPRINDYNNASGSDKALVLLAQDVFPMALEAVLERFAWQAALLYAELAEATGSSLIEGAEWEYQFVIPPDCLWLLKQTDEGDHTASYAYERRGNILLTNDLTDEDGAAAYIEYLKNTSETGGFSMLFCEAVATKCAADFAPSMNPKLKRDLVEEYELIALPRAMAENQRNVYIEDEEGAFHILDARTGGVT